MKLRGVETYRRIFSSDPETRFAVVIRIHASENDLQLLAEMGLVEFLGQVSLKLAEKEGSKRD